MSILNYKLKRGVSILVNEGPTSLIKKINNSRKSIICTKSPIEQLSFIRFKPGYIDVVLESGIKKDYILNKNSNRRLRFNVFEMNNDLNEYTLKNVFADRAFVYVYKKEKCELTNAFNMFVNGNLEDFVNELSVTFSGLKLFANYNIENAINVKTSTFFNYKGTNYYSGGAERYLIDLFDVCKDMGINLNIFQHGEIPFIRKYKDINVIGLCSGGKIDYSYKFIDNQTKKYIYHTYNNSQLHIYSAFQECYPNHIGPSIGISHGISWDSKINHYSYGKDFFWENKKIYLDGANFCDKLISVDTNTANWFQTIDYELGNRKFHVIHNYVNVDEFTARDNYLENKDKIIITYPRSLYEPRGLYIVLEIVEDILEKFEKVEFHFVGKGFLEDTKNIDKLIEKYPDRIKRYSKSPEEMKEVYSYSDISLIPTQYSEGTSLSCLEAMSSGNLVIATRIGGLTDLVINGYNGYLIEPSAEALKQTLIDVLTDFDSQNQIRKNGIEVAKTFNKKIWKEKWTQEISSFDLNKKSKNNELVEFYVNCLEDLSVSDYKLIKKELLNNNLVYIRVPVIENDISFGLLQIVSQDEEIVSKASRIFKKKNVKIKVNRSEKIIEI